MSNFDGQRLNFARGAGKYSRTAVSHESLIETGWKISHSGKSYRYESPEGKVFWSSKAVEQHLDAGKSNQNEAEKRSAEEDNSDPD